MSRLYGKGGRIGKIDARDWDRKEDEALEAVETAN